MIHRIYIITLTMAQLKLLTQAKIAFFNIKNPSSRSPILYIKKVPNIDILAPTS